MFAYFDAYISPEISEGFQEWVGRRNKGRQHVASVALVAWEACAPRQPNFRELSPEDDAASVELLFRLIDEFLAELAATT